jgi:hypothetical protein
MSKYDNDMQIIVRRVQSDEQNAPSMSAKFEMNGVKYEAPLWRWTRKDGTQVLDKNGNPMLKGKIKIDEYAERQGMKPQGEPVNPARAAALKTAGVQGDEFDDDIPF